MMNTPCIGICSTVYGDLVCRGCKRHYHEIIAWNGYTEPEKIIIYQRLAEQIASVLFDYIDRVDEDLLQAKISRLNIKLHMQATLAEKVLHLLRLGGDKIKQLSDYGIYLKSTYTHWSVAHLFNRIDKEIYLRASERKLT